MAAPSAVLQLPPEGVLLEAPAGVGELARLVQLDQRRPRLALLAHGGALLAHGGARDGGPVALDVEHPQHAQRVVGADRRVLGRHLDHDGRLAVGRLDVDLAAVGRDEDHTGRGVHRHLLVETAQGSFHRASGP